MSESENTPIDRPIMLSDLNGIKRIVQNIETLQLQFYQEHKHTVERVTALERRVWLPAAVCVVSAFVSVACAVLR